jgi:hypothetical protein
MNKTARAQIINHFYNLGMQSAMTKTAGSATEVLKALANPSKRALKATAPYIGAGGGALVGKNLATTLVPDAQRALMRSHLPGIEKAIAENATAFRGPVSTWGRTSALQEITTGARDVLTPGRAENWSKIPAEFQDKLLSKIQGSYYLADKSPVLEAVTKAINQQELAEMGLLGAGIAGGGALGHAALKDLRRHIR